MQSHLSPSPTPASLSSVRSFAVAAVLLASAPPALAQAQPVDFQTPEPVAFEALVRDAVVMPHVESRDDRGVWVRSGDTRARFEASRTSLQPVFGADSVRDRRIEIGEARATLGGEALSVPREGGRTWARRCV